MKIMDKEKNLGMTHTQKKRERWCDHVTRRSPTTPTGGRGKREIVRSYYEEITHHTNRGERGGGLWKLRLCLDLQISARRRSRPLEI